MKKIMSFKELDTLAEKLSDYAEENTTIALIGDLGTGKTTFTKTFAKKLGVEESLKSPTFNYVLEYFSGRLSLYHFDVYRLSCEEEMDDIGYEEYFFGDGVCLVEWAELFPDLIPKEAIWLTVEKDFAKGEDDRRINLRQEV